MPNNSNGCKFRKRSVSAFLPSDTGENVWFRLTLKVRMRHRHQAAMLHFTPALHARKSRLSCILDKKSFLLRWNSFKPVCTDLIPTQSQLQKHLVSVRSEQGKAAARAALVSSSLLLHARTTRPTSPYSPRFLLAMLFLDFTLSVFESKLRIVFLSTPWKKGAK